MRDVRGMNRARSNVVSAYQRVMSKHRHVPCADCEKSRHISKGTMGQMACEGLGSTATRFALAQEAMFWRVKSFDKQVGISSIKTMTK